MKKMLVLTGVLLSLGGAPTQAITLYATGYSALYTIEVPDMSVAFVGEYRVQPFIGGLCFDSRGLVMYGLSAGEWACLYTVSPATGAASLVGPLKTGFVFEGGLAFDPETHVLYAVNERGAYEPTLMTVDPATGQASEVGVIAGGEHDFAGIAFDESGQLYGVDRPTNALWKIDKLDPGGPGTLQVGPSFPGGIVMGPDGGMTNDAENHVCYCYAFGSRHLFTVDLATGRPTVLHQFRASDPVFLSLAYRGEFPTAAHGCTWGALKTSYR